MTDTPRLDPGLEHELERLNTLPLPGLREAWPPRFGRPPRLRSPELVRLMLAWRLQAEAYGGLDPETRKLLSKRTAPPRGPKLEAGARLVREWKGQRYEVEITGEGLLYSGRLYASLSEVAREITGVRWNGPRFFGLRGGS